METDAPYLAPVPKRGKRNEPAFMIETVRKLAHLRGVIGGRPSRQPQRQNFNSNGFALCSLRAVTRWPTAPSRVPNFGT
jgi:hypothetical protein